MRRPRQLRLWLSLAAAVVVVLLQQQSMFTSVSRQSTSDATAAELASTRRKLQLVQQQLKQARRDGVPTSAPTTPTSSSAAPPVPIDQIALGICSCAATICARAKAMAHWWPAGLDGDAYVDRLPDGAACETPAAPWYVGGYSESQLKTKYFG